MRASQRNIITRPEGGGITSMSEGLGNPIERFTRGMFEIAAGIGAIALGLHFFNKAKNGGKKESKDTGK